MSAVTAIPPRSLPVTYHVALKDNAISQQPDGTLTVEPTTWCIAEGCQSRNDGYDLLCICHRFLNDYLPFAPPPPEPPSATDW